MNVDQRVKLVIGDLVVQLQAAEAKIEELQAKLKEQEAPKAE
jgi:hypothetical protein